MSIKKTIMSKVPYPIRKIALDVLHSHDLRACVEITRRCNLKCIMCDIWKEKNREELKEEMTIDHLKMLFEQLRDLNCKHVTITGGEPLLRGDVSQIIYYAKKSKLHTKLITNGVLLNEERVQKLINSGIDEVDISMDGIGEIHNKIRGVKGTYDKAVNGLRILRDYNVKTVINPIVMRYNINQLPLLVALARKYDAMIEFSQLAVYGDVHKECWIDDVGSLRKIIPKMPIEHRGRISYIAKRFENVNKLDKCIMPYNRVSVKANGDIVPCFFLPSYGNIKDKTLKEIWNSEESKKVKQQAYKRLFPVCKKCLVG